LFLLLQKSLVTLPSHQGQIDGKVVLQEISAAKETSLNGISFFTNDAIPN
jgi:hypothetical protein